MRANCGQRLMPMAKISTYTSSASCSGPGSTTVTTPSTSRAIRMAGKVSWMSAMRISTASVMPPT